MRYPKDFMKVKPTNLQPAAGRLLISVPLYNDLFFNRTVVLLTDYDQESTAGLILNKISDSTVNEMVPSVRIDRPIYLGGPVVSDLLFGMHNHQSSEENPLLPDLYLGYDDILLALIEHNAIPQLKYKFFVGYSGWLPGQLEDEINQSMWVVSQETAEFIFDTEDDKMWEVAVRHLGEDYLHWLSFPHHLEDN